ncbi:PKD domain-containing protein [Chitinophaga sp. SYP-B3965]|uniref:Ig-like domain-containing protein n=1 Tax=Chitinophaga sp. SYP-B3965 TaxID=2663120 RepID=UPI00129975B6|nr:PKD domain-containing protein [Chitinophaga sp. SYP-B3965]MRG45471.1 PKD domain-containing protein [Chitinophaga sp. SYP-B3965]
MYLSPVRYTKLGLIVLQSVAFLLLGSFISLHAQAPTIASFTPTTACQGQSITITGTDFTNVTSVRIGGLNATGFTVNNPTSITVNVPDQAPASAAIQVTTQTGTVTSNTNLTVLTTPTPALTDLSSVDPFSNCVGNSTYQLVVSNSSSVTGTGNVYQINWGDNTALFTATDWAPGAQTTHTYTSQGFFPIVITITPANGCAKSVTYQFYNGNNPLASLSTSTSTTGLCAPAPVEFQIGNWFNNSPGTTYLLNFGDGSPVVTLQHPLNATNAVHLITHQYTTSSCPSIDFTATLRVSNGCFTTTYTLDKIIVRIKPTADFGVPPTACTDAPVCFTNQTLNGSSGSNSCSSASILTWDFGDGSTYTGTTPCHTYAAGTYNVTLTASNASCGSDTKTKQITVSSPSPPPVVTPVAYCRGAQAAQLTATGQGLKWYTTSTGGIGNPIAPTPSTNTAGSTTYYVSQTIPGSCESPRVPLTVTVNAPPTAPGVTTPIQLCLNQTANPLTATGTGLLWYSGPTGGIGSPTAPTPNTAATGSTNYYVSQTVNNCEGPRALIVVTVNPLAVMPTVTSPVIYCQNQTATPLTATGTGLLWYTVPAAGVGSPTAPTPSTVTPGSTTYYVSQVTGCGESPRASITVDVTQAPSATIAYTPAILCNAGNSPVAVTQTGTPGGTYSVTPAGLTIDAATGEINPTGATAGVYTIRYTIPGSGGCTNYVVTATVTINSTPTATITYPPLCTADAATNVTRTGTAGGTYSSTAGLTINPATGVITPSSSTPGTYTVTYDIAAAGPCASFSANTSVTVTQAPSASISYTPAILCNAANPPVAVTQTGTPGGTYSTAAGLTIDAATGEINPTGATPGVYTIRYTVPGAGGCANYAATTTVTINGTPNATITYPPICTADAATNVTRIGTAGGTYSSTAGLTINAATGVITPSSSTPGTYTVTYDIAAAGPCSSFSTNTSVTVTQAPTASITYTPAILCNIAAPPIPVNQTGTTGGSYSITPAGLTINTTTGEINASGATPGVYTISYTAPGTGGCANYVTSTTITVNGAPTATINYPGSPYCGGTTPPQPVTLSGNTGGVFTSTAGLSINATTGAITPSLSTPGTYTVTYTIAASSPCPGYVTTASVIINESPVITFPLPNQSICSGETAVFVPSSTVANTTYSWSVIGSLPANVTGVITGTSSGPISLSFTNTSAVSHPITVRVVPVNPSLPPCPGAPYDIVLNVRPATPAPITNTVNLCMGTPPAALQVNPIPGTTIKWYDRNMVLLNASPVINTNVPGQLTYYVSQTNTFGCESPKSAILAVVHPTAKIVSSSYTNPTSCGIPTGSITLNILDLNNGALPNIPVVVFYDKFQTTYTFTGSTDAAGRIIIPLTAGTYSGIYVVTTGGCTSQKIPDVFVLRDPTPPAQPVAGYNPPICTGTALTLSALSPTGQQAGPVDYVWVGPAFGAFADTVRNTVITFPSAAMSHAGTYIVYAIQNNCISLPATFSVVINQAPSKPVISTRTPLCVGDDLVLQATSSIPGNAALTYLWKGPGTGFPVNNPNAGINKVKIQDAGIYSVTVSSPQTGCSTTSDTLIQIGGFPVVRFAQDTLILPTGYRINLLPVITNANDPGILPIKNFTWTPSQDLICNDAICSSPVVTAKNSICYNVKVTNIFGCSGSDDVCIKVFCQNSQVFIPNAFVPNGNVPENTKLIVRATGITSVKSFRVFNRWGKIVFERSNFPPNSADFGWDGRVNGKMADTGVYIYTVDVMCENGTPYSFKGNVTLL